MPDNNPGDSPVSCPQLSLTGGSAGTIADLASLAGDVEYARWCAQAYLEQMVPEGQTADPNGDNLRRSLWTSCCITYRRVFTNGKGHLNPQTPRLKPNDNFAAALTPEQLNAHNLVLDTANKHVAHRVNELEQVMVFGVLAPAPHPRDVVGVGFMMTHYMGPIEPALVQHFMSVCDLLLGSTIQERERLSDVMTADLRTRDLDDMYSKAHIPDVQGTGLDAPAAPAVPRP